MPEKLSPEEIDERIREGQIAFLKEPLAVLIMERYGDTLDDDQMEQITDVYLLGAVTATEMFRMAFGKRERADDSVILEASMATGMAIVEIVQAHFKRRAEDSGQNGQEIPQVH